MEVSIFLSTSSIIKTKLCMKQELMRQVFVKSRRKHYAYVITELMIFKLFFHDYLCLKERFEPKCDSRLQE